MNPRTPSRSANTRSATIIMAANALGVGLCLPHDNSGRGEGARVQTAMNQVTSEVVETFNGLNDGTDQKFQISPDPSGPRSAILIGKIERGESRVNAFQARLAKNGRARRSCHLPVRSRSWPDDRHDRSRWSLLVILPLGPEGRIHQHCLLAAHVQEQAPIILPLDRATMVRERVSLYIFVN